jgi:hypothetical protein
VSDKLVPENYSSWGKGLVSHVGIAGESIPHEYFGTRTEKLYGTSFATPQHATEIMNLMMDIYTTTGVKPSIKDVLYLRDKHTIDIVGSFDGVTIGKDLRTGLGIYKYFPRQYNYSTVKMKIGQPIITVFDGVSERSVVSDVAPYTLNGRTMLPVRVLSEALELKVGWDAQTQSVVLVSIKKG